MSAKLKLGAKTSSPIEASPMLSAMGNLIEMIPVPAMAPQVTQRQSPTESESRTTIDDSFENDDARSSNSDD